MPIDLLGMACSELLLSSVAGAANMGADAWVDRALPREQIFSKFFDSRRNIGFSLVRFTNGCRYRVGLLLRS